MNRKFIFRLIIVAVIVLVSVWFATDDQRLEAAIRSMFGETSLVWVAPVLYVLLMSGLIVWMCTPLRTGERKTVAKRGQDITTIAIVFMFMWVQQYAIALETTGNVTTSIINTQTTGTPLLLPEENAQLMRIGQEYIDTQAGTLTPLKDGIVYGPQVTLACGLIVVVVVVVILGIVYVTYKIIKACSKIRDMKKKQEKDAGEDSTSTHLMSPGSKTGIRFSELNGPDVIYAASFTGATPFTPSDAEDCGCMPPFSINYEAASTTNAGLTAYLPSDANLVELTPYLESHGLSTNWVDSFSINNIPTNSLPQITYQNGAVTVNLGVTNKTQVFQYSTNMIDWVTMGTLSAPVGAKVRFGDSWHSPQSERGFWRVIGVD